MEEDAQISTAAVRAGLQQAFSNTPDIFLKNSRSSILNNGSISNNSRGGGMSGANNGRAQFHHQGHTPHQALVRVGGEDPY